MKNQNESLGKIPIKLSFRLCVLVLLAMLPAHAFSNLITTINHGNWSDGSIWSTGSAPGHNIKKGDTISILNHVIYDAGSDLMVHGVLRITYGSFTTPFNSGRKVVIKKNGTALLFASTFSLPLFNTTGNSLTGSLMNEGGMILADYSNSQIAQNLTIKDGGQTRFSNTCLTLGRDFKLDEGGVDNSFVNSCISFGGHGSGKIEVEGNSTLSFERSSVLSAGANVSFEISGGSSVIGGADGIEKLRLSKDLDNDGTWTANVAENCIAGEVKGSNRSQVTSRISPGNCNLLTALVCGGCSAPLILNNGVSSLTLTSLNYAINLKWKLGEDQSFSSMHIQRSNDGLVFKNIGTVDAASASGNLYQFADKSASGTSVYYRVMIVSLNKPVVYTNIVHHTRENVKGVKAHVFPTAFQDLISIDISELKTKSAQVNIYNLQGQVMYKKFYSQITVGQILVMNDLQQLRKGIYVVRVSFQDGNEAFSQRLVKY